MKYKSFYITFLIFLFTGILVYSEPSIPEPIQNPDAPFRLFRTANYWVFLKLDTSDGRIWILQFDIQGNDRFISKLNNRSLTDSENKIAGRFTLYPTINMFNFILLDQIDGRTWQVQWSFEPSEIFIIPID